MKSELIDKETLESLLERYFEGGAMLHKLKTSLSPFRLADGQITLAICVEQELDGRTVATPIFFMQTDKGFGEKILGFPGDTEFKFFGTSESMTKEILAGKPNRVQ
jgi:hypothetical protein